MPEVILATPSGKAAMGFADAAGPARLNGGDCGYHCGARDEKWAPSPAPGSANEFGDVFRISVSQPSGKSQVEKNPPVDVG
jgi:hypothetical protein